MEQIVNMTLLGTTFATLFVIMDPPGALPIFLALTSNYTHEHKKIAAIQATCASFAIMCVFMLTGDYILKFLHISLASLQLSGGLVLILMSMALLNGKEEELSPADASGVGIALVPMGTPILAGPGAIVAMMVAVQTSVKTVADWVAIVTALVLMHIVLWATLRFATILSKFLGKGGIMLLTRIFGLLLAAISVELIATAIFSYINGQYGI